MIIRGIKVPEFYLGFGVSGFVTGTLPSWLTHDQKKKFVVCFVVECFVKIIFITSGMPPQKKMHQTTQGQPPWDFRVGVSFTALVTIRHPACTSHVFSQQMVGVRQSSDESRTRRIPPRPSFQQLLIFQFYFGCSQLAPTAFRCSACRTTSRVLP